MHLFTCHYFLQYCSLQVKGSHKLYSVHFFFSFLQLLKNHFVYLITKHDFALILRIVFLQLCSVILALVTIDGDPVCQTH